MEELNEIYGFNVNEFSRKITHIAIYYTYDLVNGCQKILDFVASLGTHSFNFSAFSKWKWEACEHIKKIETEFKKALMEYVFFKPIGITNFKDAEITSDGEIDNLSRSNFELEQEIQKLKNSYYSQEEKLITLKKELFEIEKRENLNKNGLDLEQITNYRNMNVKVHQEMISDIETIQELTQKCKHLSEDIELKKNQQNITSIDKSVVDNYKLCQIILDKCDN